LVFRQKPNAPKEKKKEKKKKRKIQLVLAVGLSPVILKITENVFFKCLISTRS